MVEAPNLIKEFYREKIDDDFEAMRYLQTDMGKIQRIRKTSPDDWEIEELTRHILFLEAQTIEGLKKEIENDREDLKKLG